MQSYEYKVVPAPRKGLKGKGLKTPEERFANALASLMNEFGLDGWQYQRTDTLPCQERTGLRGKSTTFQNVLVFRREIAATLPDVDKVTEVADNTESPAPVLSVAVAAETIAKTHAPLLSSTHNDDTGAAPALGSATEAVEVKDPRTDVAAQ